MKNTTRNLLKLSLCSAALLFQSGITIAQDICLNDVNQFNNAVCTAKDVKIAEINVVEGPGICAEGSTVVIPELEAVLQGTAKERYDIGIFIASDGGDAKMSLSEKNDGCYHDILEPGKFADLDKDACGDIRQRQRVTKTLTDVEVLCQDTDDDGYLDVGTCLSWENNKHMACNSVEDADPGTPSKCRCEPIQIGMIPVEPKGSITIYKSTLQIEDDGAQFAFTIEDDASGETLAAGAITVEQSISAGNLEAGNYTVTETEALEKGWIFYKAECDDGVVFEWDEETPVITITLADEQDASCTFINILAS